MNAKIAFLLTKFFSSPLEALFTILIFIISKEMHATPLQLTIIGCMKPLVSLIAFRASSFVVGKTYLIRLFLLCAAILGATPCLIFPFITNTWFFIASYAIYVTAVRSSYPIWIEILKRDFDVKKLSNIVGTGNSINYAQMILIPLGAGILMDHYVSIWKTLFFCLGIFQLLTIPLLLSVRLKPISTIHIISSPWKETLKLLKENPLFAKYHIVFFLGGAGIVAIQPFLPIYFNETLKLSYTQLTTAFSFCRGISFVLACPLWVAWSKKVSLFLINTLMNTFSCLYIVFILASNGDTSWLYLAYVMYGAMQSGCEMSWNLSGPTFAGGKESTFYSGINLALVGLRGCICPFLGQFIFMQFQINGIFLFAFGLCLISLVYALRVDKMENGLLIQSRPNM